MQPRALASHMQHYIINDPRIYILKAKYSDKNNPCIGDGLLLQNHAALNYPIIVK